MSESSFVLPAAIAVFTALMIAVHFLIAPYIVSHWGLRGAIIVVALIFYTATRIERY